MGIHLQLSQAPENPVASTSLFWKTYGLWYQAKCERLLLCLLLFTFPGVRWIWGEVGQRVKSAVLRLKVSSLRLRQVLP